MALLATLAAFQAKHPLVQQIRRRRALQPRLLLWAGVFGAIALGLGGVLAWRTPALAAIAGVAALVLGIDALAVLRRRQRGLGHELLAFTAVCLSAPFAWIATKGTLAPEALGLWGLCSLYFGSSVVLLKLRRDPAASPVPIVIYGAVAIALLLLGWSQGLLDVLEAAAWGVALLKGALLLSRLEGYRSDPIGRVAAMETGSALVFLLLAGLALLPATLPPNV
jgi:hypothetical protein